MKVRIKTRPRESELDGLNLQAFTPGAVCEVSASVASWLIAQGYAEPELRSAAHDDDGTPGHDAAWRRDRLADRRRKTD